MHSISERMPYTQTYMDSRIYILDRTKWQFPPFIARGAMICRTRAAPQHKTIHAWNGHARHHFTFVSFIFLLLLTIYAIELIGNIDIVDFN